MRCTAFALVILAAALAFRCPAEDETSVDPIMGDYVGRCTHEGEAQSECYAQSVPEGNGCYRVIVTVKSPVEGKPAVRFRLRGRLDDKTRFDKLEIHGKAGKTEWKGVIQNKQLRAEGGGKKVEMNHEVRKSPTEGAKPPEGAIVLLAFEPGKPPSLDEWTNKSWKPLPDGSVLVHKGDSKTKRVFTDFKLHLEFCVPYQPVMFGQLRGNSGVYIQDHFEVQVLDSYGLKSKANDCGALYSVAAPLTNACFPPLSWQTYDITFHAARLNKDRKFVRAPTITVLHNGVKIHDERKILRGTARKGMPRIERGPIRLQDHRNPVRYRNIWIVELKDEERK